MRELAPGLMLVMLVRGGTPGSGSLPERALLDFNVAIIARAVGALGVLCTSGGAAAR